MDTDYIKVTEEVNDNLQIFTDPEICMRKSIVPCIIIKKGYWKQWTESMEHLCSWNICLKYFPNYSIFSFMYLKTDLRQNYVYFTSNVQQNTTLFRHCGKTPSKRVLQSGVVSCGQTDGHMKGNR
jgi:hypothetical protein